MERYKLSTTMNTQDKNTYHINSLTIIGSGNVAAHLTKAFENVMPTICVPPRSLENLPPFSEMTVIAVKDDAIEEVAQKLKGHAGILAHTSGSVPMSVLEGLAAGHGVFYPLQTFTKDVELDYSEIPFFIEADSKETQQKLVELAKKISGNVNLADSDQRKQLHLASVFSCNFTNCLMGISNDILMKSGIDFRVMLPLLRQTISKLTKLTPQQAQTGPAARKDFNVMDRHIGMLSDNPEFQQIYRLMSDVIIKNSKQ